MRAASTSAARRLRQASWSAEPALAAPKEPAEPAVAGKLVSPSRTTTAERERQLLGGDLGQDGVAAGADVGHVELRRSPAVDAAGRGRSLRRMLGRIAVDMPYRSASCLRGANRGWRGVAPAEAAAPSRRQSSRSWLAKGTPWPGRGRARCGAEVRADRCRAVRELVHRAFQRHRPGASPGARMNPPCGRSSGTRRCVVRRLARHRGPRVGLPAYSSKGGSRHAMISWAMATSVPSCSAPMRSRGTPAAMRRLENVCRRVNATFTGRSASGPPATREPPRPGASLEPKPPPI